MEDGGSYTPEDIRSGNVSLSIRIHCKEFGVWITAGRGWIAVALVSFGRFKPLPIVLGALFFGFLEAFQLQITALGIDFPYQIMLALPYVATILVLVVGRGSASAPQQLGVPFYRE